MMLTNKSKTPILDAIIEARTKKINRTIKSSQYFYTKAIAIGEVTKTRKKTVGDPNVLEHIQLGSLYYLMLSIYYNKPLYSTYSPTKKSIAFWSRVVETKNKSGVSGEDFIKAQFSWFDKVFKCAPPIHSLTTEKAIERALDFKGIIRLPVGSSEIKTERADLLKYYDEYIRGICKAQKITKKEFYEKLVKTGECLIPEIYLNACPVWKSLV